MRLIIIDFFFNFFFLRYAIGHAERPGLKSKVGWLDILANDTHQFYYHNNTGGPSIKVRIGLIGIRILLSLIIPHRAKLEKKLSVFRKINEFV